MPRIKKVELWQVNLAPPVPRSDAIQSFVTQETPMLRGTCDDGSQGTGYSYTIGTALQSRPIPGLGIAWDWAAIENQAIRRATVGN